jgi:hypothetical protein
MINYSKYALTLENKQKRYQFTTNTAIGIAKVLSGKDYVMYEPQWEQFYDLVQTAKAEGKDVTKTAVITHDDGREMVAITYDIKGGKLDWTSLRCGVPEQKLVDKYPEYKGVSSVFNPAGELEGSSSPAPQASDSSSSTPVDDKSAASTDKSVIPYETIKSWTETLVKYTDIGPKHPQQVIDVFSNLLNSDFTKSLGRRAKFAGKETKGEEEMDAIAALGRAFCDEETDVMSGRPEDWPTEALEVANRMQEGDPAKAKIIAAITTVKPEFNRQWGMWTNRQNKYIVIR